MIDKRSCNQVNAKTVCKFTTGWGPVSTHTPAFRCTTTPLTQDPALANSWATMASSACPLGAVGPAGAREKESVELSDDTLRCTILFSFKPSRSPSVVVFRTTLLVVVLICLDVDGAGVLDAETDPSVEGAASGAGVVEGARVGVTDTAAVGEPSLENTSVTSITTEASNDTTTVALSPRESSRNQRGQAVQGQNRLLNAPESLRHGMTLQDSRCMGM